MINMKSSNIIESFKYAITGIKDSFEERNIKIQFIVMILVIITGIIVKIEIIEWIICFILFTLVISGELFNSAIENAVDFTEKNRNDSERFGIDENARKAKDISAGAVLVLSIGSAIVGLIIFIPKIMALIL